MSKALVILSGGQDSTTCLFWALGRFESVVALTFDYGQRHRAELAAAAEIARRAGVPHETLALGPLFAGLSPLTNAALSVERYESAQALPGGLENTFVPGRNVLFLSVAANRAYVLGCDTLVLGVAQEDFGGYPDCREDFVVKMAAALAAGLDRPFSIETPLMHLTKAETVALAASLPGCLEALALSHTCYEGAYPPCSTCHACLLRARGFEQAGVADPLLARAEASAR